MDIICSSDEGSLLSVTHVNALNLMETSVRTLMSPTTKRKVVKEMAEGWTSNLFLPHLIGFPICFYFK